MIDIDENYSGHENLEAISYSHRFNKWMYGEVLPGLYGDILEVGSGIGTFSEILANDFPNSCLTLTDVSDKYIENLKKKYQNNKNITIHKLNLNNHTDYERIGYGQFDSIMAINVLEHVENDEFALAQLYNMLKDKGTLVVLVPCHKVLYNVIDKNIGHFRRYTKKDLENKISKSGFDIDRMFYFNAIGIIGWYLNGNLFKKSQVNGNGLKVLDILVPLLKRTERIAGKRVGLSLVGYLMKGYQNIKPA